LRTVTGRVSSGSIAMRFGALPQLGHFLSEMDRIEYAKIYRDSLKFQLGHVFSDMDRCRSR